MSEPATTTNVASQPEPPASNASPSTASTAPPATLLTRSFVTVIVAQMAFGYSGSTFLLLPKYLSTRLHASAGQIGHVTAVSALAAVLAIPAVGGMIDRVGRKPLVMAGAIVCSLYAFAWVFVEHLGYGVDALQALSGVAYMFAYNAAGTMIVDRAPPERLGQALGLFGASNMAMSAVSPAVAEWLATRAGWHAAFMLGGVVALLSPILIATIDEAKPDKPEHSDPLKQLYVTADVVRRVWPASVAMIACGATYAAVFTYYQPFVIAQGAKLVSPFFIGFTVAAVATRMFFGSLPDRVGRHRAALASFTFYACVALAMTQLTPSRLLVFGFLFGLAHGVFYPALNALCVEQTRPEERGLAMTLVMGTFRLGNMVSALVFGWVAERQGYPIVFALASIVAFAGAGALWQGGKKHVAPAGQSRA